MTKPLPSWLSLLKPYRWWIAGGVALTGFAGTAAWLVHKLARKPIEASK